MAITTTLILDAINRGVTIPNNQVRFSSADLLKFADEETEALLLPTVLSLRSEFLVKKKLVPVVNSQGTYKIPYRASGRTLRDLKLATSDNTYVKTLSYISPEDSHAFLPSAIGEPWGFTVRGDNIILLPTPGVSSSAYNLEFYYELKPSYLIPVASSGVINSINTTTGVVTLSSAISAFTTGATMDFVDAKSGCSVKGEDIVNTNVSSTLITFAAADLPSDLAVGDYLCLSNQSPVLQFPDECHQTLVQAVICRVLEALGDFEGLKAASEKLDKKVAAMQQMLTPRVESEVPVVINRRGLLPQRPYNFRYRYLL